MDSIEKLKNIFRDFPAVGPRTAGRFVYYLIKQPKEKISELVSALQELSSKIKLCSLCYQPFEPLDSAQNEFCTICQNPSRNKTLLCVVEKEADLQIIENTKKYNGLYFILGGVASMMREEDADRLRLEQLKKRASSGSFAEIIIALNPTPEGRATLVLTEKAIKGVLPGAKITHLAQGIPVGGELEYADEETLESAFEGRK